MKPVVRAEHLDPATDGVAYRQVLLDVLGRDDPADVQAATPTELRRLVDEAGPDLRRCPALGEWSVLELIGHMADAEIVSAGRYRWILAHDRPEILPYDQDLWVERLRYNELPVADVLGPFEALREANIALWRRTPVDERSRYGVHRERGPESYELTFSLIAGHDRYHLSQAHRTLADVRAAG